VALTDLIMEVVGREVRAAAEPALPPLALEVPHILPPHKTHPPPQHPSSRPAITPQIRCAMTRLLILSVPAYAIPPPPKRTQALTDRKVGSMGLLECRTSDKAAAA
jgi:hypothetical protein